MRLAAALCFAAGVLGLVVGAFVDPRRLFFCYLAAFAYFVSLALGAAFVVMIAHAARVRWLVPLRRLAEYPVATLPLFVPLVVPILLGLSTLYPWVDRVGTYPEEERELIVKKLFWLEPGFFAGRSFFYLLVWAIFAVLLVRSSLAQDRGASERPRLEGISVVGLPVFALTLTFASFDWLMSLEPIWLSTVYGVYYFAGGFLGALALVALLGAAFGRRGLLPPEVGVEHHYAAGKMLLSFVIFWAYIAFVQLLLIWVANLPREVVFFERRVQHGWGWVSAAVCATQFVIPFFVLLSRELKRKPGQLAIVAIWLLAAHWLDVWWLVLPELDRGGPILHWLDLAAFLAIGGAAVLWSSFLFRSKARVPEGDPFLEPGLRYRGS